MTTVPLSFGEERVWRAMCVEGGPAFVDCPLHFVSTARLGGSLDVRALEAAVNAFVRRHDVTRSTYIAVAHQPVRVIAPFAPTALAVMDVPADDPRADAVQEVLGDLVRCPFDLSAGPLLRIRLLRLGPTDHVLAIVAHHIIFDGWSLHVMWRELGAVYETEVNGRALTRPELTATYGDFVTWQRRRLDADRLAVLGRHWTAHLRGATGLHVPGDDPPHASDSPRSAAEPVVFADDLADDLRRFCRQRGMTSGAGLAAILNLLLHRMTGRVDVVIGMPVLERNRPEFEALAGMFTNLVVMRSDLSGNPTFLEVLDRTRRTFIDTFKHRELPFGVLTDADHAVDPDLVRVVFNFFSARRAAVSLPGLTVRSVDLIGEGPSFADLGLHLFDTGGAIHGFVTYATRRFSRARVVRLIGSLEALTREVVTAPDRPLGDYAGWLSAPGGDAPRAHASGALACRPI